MDEASWTADEMMTIAAGRALTDGTSVFVTDKPADPIEVDALPGSEIYLLWGTEDGAPTVGAGPPWCIELHRAEAASVRMTKDCASTPSRVA